MLLATSKKKPSSINILPYKPISSKLLFTRDPANTLTTYLPIGYITHYKIPTVFLYRGRGEALFRMRLKYLNIETDNGILPDKFPSIEVNDRHTKWLIL